MPRIAVKNDDIEERSRTGDAHTHRCAYEVYLKELVLRTVELWGLASLNSVAQAGNAGVDSIV